MEQKLLLKDLCARLPYKVKCKFGDTIKTLDGVYRDGSLWLEVQLSGLHYDCTIDDVKPYLRPMSSMTEEESKEFALLQTDFYVDGILYPIAATNMVNWLNSHYFDYSGLIEKGLALEAPEGMYKTE